MNPPPPLQGGQGGAAARGNLMFTSKGSSCYQLGSCVAITSQLRWNKCSTKGFHDLLPHLVLT